MLGLIIMSLPLGIAVGLSGLALVRTEPDGSASEIKEANLGTTAAASSLAVIPPSTMTWRFGRDFQRRLRSHKEFG